MKVKKVLKVVLGTVAALLVFLLLTFLFWLGPAIKLIAHTVGPMALGTPLHIEKLSINPIKGTVHLIDFSIENPQIFGKSNAVSIASLDLEVDMASLFSSTIVVHQVEINSPYFIYEQDLSSDNISEFIANIQQFANIDPSAPPKPEKKKKNQKPSEPVIVIVESLAINDVQFNLANTHDQKLDIGVGFEALTVSMTNGTVQLNNLYVKNPKRLKTKYLFTLDEVDIRMVPGSIYSTNIHFEAVDIRNPHFFIEHNPETDTVGEFLKIVNSLSVKIPTNAVPEDAPLPVDHEDGADAAAPPPMITLDHFGINNVQMHAVNIGDPSLNILLGLRSFSVALERGLIVLDQLYLSNPAGFTTPNLFSLEKFEVQMTPGSHTADTLIVEDVQIIKPHVFLELNNTTDTVSAFLRIANGYLNRLPDYEFPQLPPAPEPPAESAAAAPETAAAPPPVKLQHVVVDGIELQLLDLTNTNAPTALPHMIAGIEEVVMKLAEGNVSVNNIRIPNVAGFAASNILHIADINVAIEPESIYADQVVINSVFINSPEVNLEQTVDSGNVSSLQKSLMNFSPDADELPQRTAASTPPSDTARPAETNAPIPLAEQPVILHQLLVTNLAVNLKMPAVTNGMMQGLGDSFNMKKLNLMGKNTSTTNDVIDPNAPLKLVSFNRLSLEPLKGLLQINDLRVSNPPGYSKNNLLELDEFRVGLDPDTLQSQTLHIREIVLMKPKIRYERQITSDNIKTLQMEIEQASMQRKEEMKPEKSSIDATEKEEPAPVAANKQKVIIDHVLIPNGIVRAKLSALPPIPVPLPTIELNDLGKREGGTTLTEAGTQIFTSLYDAIIGSVGNATGFAGDALKGAGALTFGAFEDMANSFGDRGDGNTKRAEQETDDQPEKKSRRSRGAGGRRRMIP